MIIVFLFMVIMIYVIREFDLFFCINVFGKVFLVVIVWVSMLSVDIFVGFNIENIN